MPKKFFNEGTGTFDFSASASDISMDAFNKMDNKYEILNERTYISKSDPLNYVNGSNPLMIAIYIRPDAVPVLLKAMESLNSNQIINILKGLNREGRNPLMVAGKYDHKYNYVPYIFNAIASSNVLAIEIKYSLMKELLDNLSLAESNQLQKEDQNLINVFLQMKIATWEKDITQFLVELKPIQSDSPNYLINPNSPQSLLYRDLDNALSLYLKSPKTKADLKLFHDVWNNKINEARMSGQFDSHVQICDVLATIALVLSIIGIVYLAYQAGKNQARNRSLFFPGILEKKLNKLQDKGLEAADFPTNENKGQHVQDSPIPSAPVRSDAQQDNPPSYNPNA